MSFSSLSFVYLFLPLALVAVFAAPKGWRNGVLLVESLLFFAWGEPKFLLPLVGGCLFDYLVARAIRALPVEGRKSKVESHRGKADRATPQKHLLSIIHYLLSIISCDARSVLCAAGVAANVLALGYFKYAGFAIGGVNAVLSAAGLDFALPAVKVALPLGISFFTFQKISYLVDVRRGVVTPAPNFGRYLLYIALFPQLTMGPILRYHEIADQFGDRSVSTEDFLQGLWRFALGLARKALVAGPLAGVSAAAFSVTDDGGGLTAASAWIGIYAYTLQIYFDFAGYCDMAVGIGRMLGFRFPENFDAPYIARDMGEFWRRWHITLGAFMKEYLYIPLGGNRCSKARSLLNNWIVFLVSGIWHGASWNFIVWGAWHGIWIVAAKLFRPQQCTMHNAQCTMHNGGAKHSKHLLSIIYYPLSIICRARLAGAAWTFLMVMFGWVFFAAEDFRSAAAYFRSLAGCGGTGASIMAELTPQALCAMAAGTILSFLPAVVPKLGIADWRIGADGSNAAIWSRTIATALLLLLATLPLLTSGFSPFIYNRF